MRKLLLTITYLLLPLSASALNYTVEDNMIDENSATTNNGEASTVNISRPLFGSTERRTVVMPVGNVYNTVGPNKIIDSAFVRMFTLLGSSSAFDIKISQLAKPTTENGSTWNRHHGGCDWGTAGAKNTSADPIENDECGSANDASSTILATVSVTTADNIWYEWNVTNSFRDMYRGRYNSEGWVLYTTVNGTQCVFQSTESDSEMVVRYVVHDDTAKAFTQSAETTIVKHSFNSVVASHNDNYYKRTDSLQLIESGTYLIMASFGGGENSASANAEFLLIARNDTLGHIVYKSPTATGTTYKPMFMAKLYRKHTDDTVHIYLKIQNSSTSTTEIRNRTITAMRMEQYGAEGVGWIHAEEDTTNVGTAWWGRCRARIKPSADEDWFVLTYAEHTGDNVDAEGRTRLALINKDTDDTTFTDLRREGYEATTDRLFSGAFRMVAIEADSEYVMEFQIATESQTIDVPRAMLIAWRKDAHQSVTISGTGQSCTSSANESVTDTAAVLTSLGDDYHEDFMIFASMGIVAGAINGNPRAFVVNSNGEIPSLIDTALNRDQSANNRNTDTIPFLSHVLYDMEDSLYLTANLKGLTETNYSYCAPTIAIIGTQNNPPSSELAGLNYQCAKDSNDIDDAHLYEGTSTTNYGTADTLIIGSNGTNEFHIVIKDNTLGGDFPTGFDPQDLPGAGTLWVEIKTFPVAGESLTVDLYREYSHQAGDEWVEGEVSYDDLKTGTAWTSGGGDRTIVTEDVVVFVRVNDSSCLVRIGGVFFDTLHVKHDRHMPIPFPALVIDSFTGTSPASHGLFLVTDDAKTSANGRVTFWSSNTDSAHNRPYFTYQYAERGSGVALPESPSDFPVDSFILIGRNSNLPGWDFDSANKYIDDGFNWESGSSKNTDFGGLGTIFIGKQAGSETRRAIAYYRINFIDSLVPSGKQVDSAVLGIIPQSIESGADTMYLRFSEGRGPRYQDSDDNLATSDASLNYNSTHRSSSQGTSWNRYTNFNNQWDTAGPVDQLVDREDWYSTGDDSAVRVGGKIRGGGADWVRGILSTDISVGDTIFIRLPAQYFNDGDAGLLVESLIVDNRGWDDSVPASESYKPMGFFIGDSANMSPNATVANGADWSFQTPAIHSPFANVNSLPFVVLYLSDAPLPPSSSNSRSGGTRRGTEETNRSGTGG